MNITKFFIFQLTILIVKEFFLLNYKNIALSEFFFQISKIINEISKNKKVFNGCDFVGILSKKFSIILWKIIVIH